MHLPAKSSETWRASLSLGRSRDGRACGGAKRELCVDLRKDVPKDPPQGAKERDSSLFPWGITLVDRTELKKKKKKKHTKKKPLPPPLGKKKRILRGIVRVKSRKA